MSLLIKDIKAEERPRERLLKYGAEAMSNIELLSIILKTGTKGESVNTLAIKILNKFENISDLKNLNKEQLLSMKGIKGAKAAEFLAAIELGRRIFLINNKQSIEKYTTASTVYEGNKYLFQDKKQEYFYCLYLNSKKELIERKLLFMGTLNKSLVHPREIFKEAYLLSASSIICMHNHPSGDIMPSADDIFLTNSLIEIGKLQQIPVVDHIIFGDNEYYSFYENNRYIRQWVKQTKNIITKKR